jgi:hypothetical protein
VNAIETVTGAAVSGIWKLAAIVLLIALVLTGAGMGGGWWLAARDRDAAKLDLAAEQAKSAEYAIAIREQNRAVEAMKDRTTVAEQRGLDAQKLAAANGKRFDMVLAATRATRAVSCTDAMPVVDMVLDAVR